MPAYGAHFSIAGGLINAARTCRELQCDTFQLFTKNAAQWAAKPIADDEATTFRKAVRAAGAEFVTAHDSYLINLAATDETLFEKSVAAMVVELERAEQLGLAYLVAHPGAHVGSGDDAGLLRVIRGLDLAHDRCPGFTVKILIETTAGQGTTLGWKFEHLATIRHGVREPERLGVCLDTCHVFAAGYDLRTPEAYAATMQEFDAVVGLKHIRLFHVNDSKKGLGSRVDRHAGLGEGMIGESAFRSLTTDDRFRTVPKILETPKENDAGEPQDPVNLGRLRAWGAGG